jgi:hypothetical protein
LSTIAALSQQLAQSSATGAGRLPAVLPTRKAPANGHAAPSIARSSKAAAGVPVHGVTRAAGLTRCAGASGCSLPWSCRHGRACSRHQLRGRGRGPLRRIMQRELSVLALRGFGLGRRAVRRLAHRRRRDRPDSAVPPFIDARFGSRTPTRCRFPMLSGGVVSTWRRVRPTSASATLS